MQEGRRQEAEGKKTCKVSFLTFFNCIVISATLHLITYLARATSVADQTLNNRAGVHYYTIKAQHYYLAVEC